MSKWFLFVKFPRISSMMQVIWQAERLFQDMLIFSIQRGCYKYPVLIHQQLKALEKLQDFSLKCCRDLISTSRKRDFKYYHFQKSNWLKLKRNHGFSCDPNTFKIALVVRFIARLLRALFADWGIIFSSEMGSFIVFIFPKTDAICPYFFILKLYLAHNKT